MGKTLVKIKSDNLFVKIFPDRKSLGKKAAENVAEKKELLKKPTEVRVIFAAAAVRKTLNNKINTKCPATILRQHKDATLFLEKDSAFKLETNLK